jgi:hypothetical protein
MEVIADYGSGLLAECPICAIRTVVAKVAKEVATDAVVNATKEVAKEAPVIKADVKTAIENEFEKLEAEVKSFEQTITGN